MGMNCSTRASFVYQEISSSHRPYFNGNSPPDPPAGYQLSGWGDVGVGVSVWSAAMEGRHLIDKQTYFFVPCLFPLHQIFRSSNVEPVRPSKHP